MERARKKYSVYVGNIPPGMSEESLMKIFSPCAPVRELITFPVKKGGFNYGFVEFYNFEGVERAVQEINNWAIQGTKLIVTYSKETQKLPEYHERMAMKEPPKAPEKWKGRRHLPSKEDLMYLSRVRDVSRDINKSAHPDDVVDIGRLLDELDKMDLSRGPSVPQDFLNLSVDHALIARKLQTRPFFCKEDYSVDEAEQFLRERSNARGALDSLGEAGGRRRRNRKKQEKDIQLDPALQLKLGKLLELHKANQSPSPPNASAGKAGQEASTSSTGEAACKQAEDMGASAISSLPNGNRRLYVSTPQHCGPVMEYGASDSGVSLPSTPSDNGDGSEFAERRTPVNEAVSCEQMAPAWHSGTCPGDSRTVGQPVEGEKQTPLARLEFLRQFAASPCIGSYPSLSPGTAPGPVQNGIAASHPWPNGLGRGILGHSHFGARLQSPGQPKQ